MCKLIKDTVDCVNLHAKCYSSAEIREDKDRHIAGRMQQFAQGGAIQLNVNRIFDRVALQIAFRTAICFRENLSYIQFSLYCVLPYIQSLFYT